MYRVLPLRVPLLQAPIRARLDGLARACRCLTALAATAAIAAGTGAPAAASEAGLASALGSAMAPAGAWSGAYVVNADTGRPVLRWRHGTARILASNTKLYTTAAALARFGTEGTLATEVRGAGELTDTGVWRGDLYLVGGGDPTFGSRGFAQHAYGAPGASVEALAEQLEQAGIERVAGRVYGDESRFDGLRGGPESGYATSIWVGPLSALAFNRGLANESGSSFQATPAAFAAARLSDALRRRGTPVRDRPIAGATPRGAETLAAVESPPMSRLIALTNKPSDNYFAEMLLKDLALQAGGRGTTAAGARIAAGFAKRIGGRPARLADGSGLSRANRASPYRIVRLLLALREREDFPAFLRSLSIAGRDGTLGPRMRGGPARGHCRGKTGTLSNVSAVSGYCRARSGDTYVFSIVMNGVDPYGARGLQDRMLQTLAGVR